MEKGNFLIVYFSYTGNTKMISNMIKKINCDMVELKPIKPYSTNYQEVVDDEQNSGANNIIPEMQKVDVNLSKYDKIIIGTPTWWYRPAPVVRAFLKNYDLSGKVIIPFSTNAGWLGKTFKEIEKLCPNSKVQNEMNVVFESYSDNLVTSKSEIDNWINNLQ